jgi:hypothetical protein
VISGIFFVIRNGLRWRDAPPAMVRIRRSITGSCAGAGSACSTISLPNWRAKVSAYQQPY